MTVVCVSESSGHQSRNVLRHAGPLSIRIEVAQARVDEAAIAARHQRSPHQLDQRLCRHRVVVEHVVGQAPLGRRGVFAHRGQALVDQIEIPLQRFFGIGRLLAAKETDPAGGAERRVGAAAGR